ncbi:MAG TPA: hypothetical protein VII55_02625 [Candidatus Saccharimonadales bacterium]
MFGHQDDQSAQQDGAAISDESIQGALNESDDQATVPATAVTPGTTAIPDPIAASIDAPSGSPPPPPADAQAWQHPGAPIEAGKEPIKDIISPAGGFPKKPTYQYPVPTIAPSDSSLPQLDDSDHANDELIEVKKKALDDLVPIIDKLDLPPEEKFRTIMMMIQSSDNQALVKAAYTAAHSIEDETVRAQSLLDIINEVNYFTSPHDDQPPQADS